jgi:hypothetical protein
LLDSANYIRRERYAALQTTPGMANDRKACKVAFSVTSPGMAGTYRNPRFSGTWLRVKIVGRYGQANLGLRGSPHDSASRK